MLSTWLSDSRDGENTEVAQTLRPSGCFLLRRLTGFQAEPSETHNQQADSETTIEDLPYEKFIRKFERSRGQVQVEHAPALEAHQQGALIEHFLLQISKSHVPCVFSLDYADDHAKEDEEHVL